VVTNELNLDFTVDLPAGKRLIEITNAGVDWVYLDWVRLERLLPASYSGNWQPAPESIGLQGQRESLLYVVAPRTGFPANATNGLLATQTSQQITLSNWVDGSFIAEWYYPSNGLYAGTTRSAAANRLLTLPLPEFREDLAGIVYPLPRFLVAGLESANPKFEFLSETGGRYVLHRSQDLITWDAEALITNTTGRYLFIAPTGAVEVPSFFRAVQQSLP